MLKQVMRYACFICNDSARVIFNIEDVDVTRIERFKATFTALLTTFARRMVSWCLPEISLMLLTVYLYFIVIGDRDNSIVSIFISVGL